MKTIDEIDAEMRALEAQRHDIKRALRALQADRDELVAIAKLSENMSPGKLRAMAKVLSAHGIPSAEGIGELAAGK